MMGNLVIVPFILKINERIYFFNNEINYLNRVTNAQTSIILTLVYIKKKKSIKK